MMAYMDSFTFLHWISRKLQVFQECHSILGSKPKFSFPLLTESIQWSILDLMSLFIFYICESTKIGRRYMSDCTTRSQKNDGTNTMWEAIYKFSTLGWSTQAWGLALPSCSVTLSNSSRTDKLETNSIWFCCSSLHYGKGKIFLGT